MKKWLNKPLSINKFNCNTILKNNLFKTRLIIIDKGKKSDY